jgi:hypothetical protein
MLEVARSNILSMGEDYFNLTLCGKEQESVENSETRHNACDTGQAVIQLLPERGTDLLS